MTINPGDFELNIKNCFSLNDEVRNKSTLFIDKLCQSNPDLYMRMHLSMFTYSKEITVCAPFTNYYICYFYIKVHLFSYTQMEKCIDTRDPSESILFHLSKETFQYFKQELVKLFTQYTLNVQVHDGISRILGHFTSMLFQMGLFLLYPMFLIIYRQVF